MHQKSSKIASWRPLGTSCGRLGGILGGLGGILGSPKRHLGDYCMLLNRLGRFQNAPERETMIFHWFWKVWVGGPHGRGMVPRRLSDPLNDHFQRPYTTATATGHWLLATATGQWLFAVCCLTLTHAVAQSAVADIQNT